LAESIVAEFYFAAFDDDPCSVPSLRRLAKYSLAETAFPLTFFAL